MRGWPTSSRPRRIFRPGIIAYLSHAPYSGNQHAEEAAEEKTQNTLEKIFVLLREHTGNDFSSYKRSTIQRRIARRMGLHQIDKVDAYARYLRENPPEIELLSRELLIGVTSFFRDPEVWDHLKKEVVPGIIATRPGGSTVRAWVPGCSTGEEAYSIAILLKEGLESLNLPKNLNFQIFATDLDREAIEKARQGVYPANIAADVSPERLRRFFLEEERGLRINKRSARWWYLRRRISSRMAVHPARSRVLSQSAPLSRARAAKKAHPAFSLHTQSRRDSLLGQRRDDRHVHDPLSRKPSGPKPVSSTICWISHDLHPASSPSSAPACSSNPSWRLRSTR